MKVPKLLRTLTLAAGLMAASVPSLSVPAEAAWGGWHGGWHSGWGWGGLGLGLAAGALVEAALTAPYWGYRYGYEITFQVTARDDDVRIANLFVLKNIVTQIHQTVGRSPQ